MKRQYPPYINPSNFYLACDPVLQTPIATVGPLLAVLIPVPARGRRRKRGWGRKNWVRRQASCGELTQVEPQVKLSPELFDGRKRQPMKKIYINSYIQVLVAQGAVLILIASACMFA